ncbi:MAG: hypothetical protein ACC656_13300, partial [Candidatus Heimdallarchaeota archaeon]
DLVYNGYSNRIYDIDIVENPFASLYYSPSKTTKANIAIFTYTDWGVNQVSYTLKTSIPEYEIGFFDVLPILLFIIVVIVIIVFYVKRRNKAKERDYQNYRVRQNYAQNLNQPYQPPQQMSYQPQTSGMFCTGCASRYSNPNLKFCNGCGVKL